MPRVKRGTKRRAKRKKILERASGYFLTKSKLYRAAKEAVDRGLKFAYSGRKQKKRQYRSIWIVRIGAAARLNGLNYNQFISGLKKERRRDEVRGAIVAAFGVLPIDGLGTTGRLQADRRGPRRQPGPRSIAAGEARRSSRRG